MKVVVDGITYENEDLAPDLGSWVNTARNDDTTSSYKGLSARFSKLPTVAQYPQYKNKLVTGSLAIAVDTGAYKMYEATTDKWY